jgi:hypothetical protein
VGVIGEAGRADAGAFLSRLVRLDPAALVRLRPSGASAEIWAMLPFGVLVVRTLSVPVDGDVTVEATALLADLAPDPAPDLASDPASDLAAGLASGLAVAGSPRRRDADWRWARPPSRGRVVETVPAAEVGRVASAASTTLRAAVDSGVGGRPVGERAVRDALLDHVPIVVTGEDGERVEVSQRLVQAVVRMGFLGSTIGEETIAVRIAGAWTGLAASYGSAWYRRNSPMQIT